MSDHEEKNEQANEETWASVMGVRIVHAAAEEVVAELEVGAKHRQAGGLVHGGVYSGLIESAASIGAAITCRARGQGLPVGLENHTSFVRSAREGTIRVRATPVTRGRATQLWEATVRDEKGQILATGRVRLFNVEQAAT